MSAASMWTGLNGTHVDEGGMMTLPTTLRTLVRMYEERGLLPPWRAMVSSLGYLPPGVFLRRRPPLSHWRCELLLASGTSGLGCWPKTFGHQAARYISPQITREWITCSLNGLLENSTAPRAAVARSASGSGDTRSGVPPMQCADDRQDTQSGTAYHGWANTTVGFWRQPSAKPGKKVLGNGGWVGDEDMPGDQHYTGWEIEWGRDGGGTTDHCWHVDTTGCRCAGDSKRDPSATRGGTGYFLLSGFCHLGLWCLLGPPRWTESHRLAQAM